MLFSVPVTHKAWLFDGNSGVGKEHLPRCLGYYEISFNVVKKYFGELCGTFKFKFDLSLEKGILPGDLQITRVTSAFKGGDRSELEHFRPIPVFPRFSKIV